MVVCGRALDLQGEQGVETGDERAEERAEERAVRGPLGVPVATRRPVVDWAARVVPVWAVPVAKRTVTAMTVSVMARRGWEGPRQYQP